MLQNGYNIGIVNSLKVIVYVKGKPAPTRHSAFNYASNRAEWQVGVVMCWISRNRAASTGVGGMHDTK